MTAIKKKL